jgi:hypothetical protein
MNDTTENRLTAKHRYFSLHPKEALRAAEKLLVAIYLATGRAPHLVNAWQYIDGKWVRQPLCTPEDDGNAAPRIEVLELWSVMFARVSFDHCFVPPS